MNAVSPIRAGLFAAAIAAALGAALGAACGSSAPTIRPSSPFRAEHARFFDDAVDLIQDPERLGGRWASEWANDLRARIGYADLIGRVRIESITTETDAEQKRRLHVNVHVVERIRGRVPQGRNLDLAVAEGRDGWESVLSNERALLNDRFVVFVKWYTDRLGLVRNHWHLSPASGDLVATIRSQLEDLALAPPPAEQAPAAGQAPAAEETPAPAQIPTTEQAPAAPQAPAAEQTPAAAQAAPPGAPAVE